MKKICFVIVLLLTACTILNGKPSILDDSSCDAPCWNEITVGVTTKEEMLSILKDLPNVDQNFAVLNSPWKIYDGGVNFYLYPSGLNKHDVVVDANFLKDKVVNISFCGDLGITFDDMVRKAGEPNNIIVIPSPSGGLFVTAINQDIGIQFAYDTANIPKRLRAGIVPEIQIDCLIYFDPKLYEEMLEAQQFSAGHLDAEGTLEAMQPWAGYGDLEKYISER